MSLGAVSALSGGLWLFGFCLQKYQGSRTTTKPSWPAVRTASKVPVIHCGWVPVGSRTEPRGASGTQVVPGLGRAEQALRVLCGGQIMVQPSCGLNGSARSLFLSDLPPELRAGMTILPGLDAIVSDGVAVVSREWLVQGPPGTVLAPRAPGHHISRHVPTPPLETHPYSSILQGRGQVGQGGESLGTSSMSLGIPSLWTSSTQASFLDPAGTADKACLGRIHPLGSDP